MCAFKLLAAARSARHLQGRYGRDTGWELLLSSIIYPKKKSSAYPVSCSQLKAIRG
jgi:hypothetical protein